jgi:hypothetical protein
MNDFQEQAKNWLRNVVKQNPDKIKAGVEKAGDLIDKQTGGKYAEKVDSVQQKVGSFVDKQNSGDATGQGEAKTGEVPTSASGGAAPGSTTGTADGSSAGTAQTPSDQPTADTGDTSDGVAQPQRDSQNS